MEVSDVGSETDNEKRTFARHIRLKHRLQTEDRGDLRSDCDLHSCRKKDWKIVDKALSARLEGRRPHPQSNANIAGYSDLEKRNQRAFKKHDEKIARRNFRQRQHCKNYADQGTGWFNEGDWLNPPFLVPEWNTAIEQQATSPSDAFLFPILESTSSLGEPMHGKRPFGIGYYSEDDFRKDSLIKNVGEEMSIRRVVQRSSEDDSLGSTSFGDTLSESENTEGLEDEEWQEISAFDDGQQIASQFQPDPNDADEENSTDEDNSTDEENPLKRYWRTKQYGRRERNIDRKIQKKFGQGISEAEWNEHRHRVNVEGARYLKIN
jgi:hypothetical protein